MTFFALNEIDQKLLRYVDFDGGVFFEAGANDGLNQSNTAYFERERGWTGVLVEPIFHRMKQCVENRPKSKVVWSALVGPDFTQPYIELAYYDLMTFTLDKANPANPVSRGQAAQTCMPEGEQSFTAQAPARTLTSILTDASVNRIDLFSLDVESYEVEALRGLDLDHFDIPLILVECILVADGVRALLEPKYNLVEKLSDNDYLFQRR